MAGQPRHITAAEGVHGWGEQYYHHRAHIRKLDNVPDFPQLGGGGGFVVVVGVGVISITHLIMGTAGW